jgi:hypothetical protein
MSLLTTASHLSAIALATEEARQRSTVPTDSAQIPPPFPKIMFEEMKSSREK